MFLELVMIENADSTPEAPLWSSCVFAPHSVGSPVPEVDLLGLVQVVWDIMFIFRTVVR